MFKSLREKSHWTGTQCSEDEAYSGWCWVFWITVLKLFRPCFVFLYLLSHFSNVRFHCFSPFIYRGNIPSHYPKDKNARIDRDFSKFFEIIWKIAETLEISTVLSDLEICVLSDFFWLFDIYILEKCVENVKFVKSSQNCFSKIEIRISKSKTRVRRIFPS